MTQDRRITDKLPTEPLVFTDANLIAAALKHLDAERAEGCFLSVPDTSPALYVAAGPVSFIAKHVATPSPAKVDLSKLTRYDHRGCLMAPDETGDYYLVADVVSAAAAQEPSKITDTDSAREFLVKFSQQHFSDKTFHRYIRNDQGNRQGLAGDFAFQLAKALESLAAPVAAQAAVPEDRQKLRDEAMSAAVYFGDCNYEDAQNRGKGGPGVEAKVQRAAKRMADAISALAAAPEVPPAEPAAEKLVEPDNLPRWIDNLKGNDPTVDALIEYIIKLRAPAEPAPIQTSALTDDLEQIAKSWDGCMVDAPGGEMGVGDTLRAQFRQLERVLARLSKPTTEGTAAEAVPSIDTPEFRELLEAHRKVYNAALKAFDPMSDDQRPDNEVGKAWGNLIAHINRHIAAQPPAGRDAIRDQWLDYAVLACDAERVEEAGHESDRGYNMAIEHCIGAIRALKSMERAADTKGDAK